MRKKQEKRVRRHKRVRAKAFGTNKRPRLCVFKSSKHIYAQLIDDEKGKTITAASDSELQPKTKKGKSKVAVAYEVGKLIAKKALGKKFAEVIFDRGGYRYQGRVKALAEGAREGGLKF
ncbi:MAG: 50S ribosomal protein L18 [Parcubacteria group bacterium CG1_02_39_15]|uniref:Large ribosomal subunit protein uL18 n=1 Tax=Candidatus Nealsonbacteria bacterium CG_4_10_14_0_2_um_filter_39_15 TaxID=1974681 RepID=A0A2M7UWQ0_9BACT|nr:MAG: 50S ribosomal protein L18 [Parcubacteria group bacterium CG1_02_39_15]PIZ88367.1 MAG: 50S ribosomal protein L18 [Candidatus Nealsonbacteria bacterium CG_4_10_14_0_2_um_filter_39_15]